MVRVSSVNFYAMAAATYFVDLIRAEDHRSRIAPPLSAFHFEVVLRPRPPARHHLDPRCAECCGHVTLVIFVVEVGIFPLLRERIYSARPVLLGREIWYMLAAPLIDLPSWLAAFKEPQLMQKNENLQNSPPARRLPRDSV